MSGKDQRRERAIPWLKKNGYEDVAAQIEELIASWKKSGKKTRRNWWEILAGGKSGHPRTVDGITFPVLRAAQIRQGLKVTDNAEERGEETNGLSRWTMGRWEGK